MATETEPNRDIELDILGEEALNDDHPSAAIETDAPYGYKKDGTPARKRGRKPGSGSTTTSSTGTRARSTSTRGSLQNQIGSLIFTINMPLSMFLPKDALDTVEVLALAHSIDQECQRNARFRKMVEQALAVQGGTSLVLVIAAIAGRRVVRHNLIEVPAPIGNEGADAALGAVIGFTTGQQPSPDLQAMMKQATSSSDAN